MSMVKRFDAYLLRLYEVLGHADHDEPMREYCTGLMLPLKRKSMEPIAAHVGPQAVSAKHQSLLHFVGNSTWSDFCQIFFVQFELKQAPVCRSPLLGCLTERDIIWNGQARIIFNISNLAPCTSPSTRSTVRLTH